MNFTLRGPAIFVVGCPRSGTTLLQSILSAHPRITIPPEQDFLIEEYSLFRRFGRNPVPTGDIKAMVDRLYQPENSFRNWGLDRALLEERLCAGPCSYGEIGLTIYQAFNEAHGGKDRWGSKVPYFVLHIEELRRLYPDALFIHIIRDGRAVLRSIKKRNGRGPTSFPQQDFKIARLWDRYVTVGQQQGQRVGGSAYLEIRYEDLLMQTESVLEKVFNFIGEGLHSSVRDHYDLTAGTGLFKGMDLSLYLKKGIDTANVDSWRREISADEIFTAQAVGGKTLERLGYPCLSAEATLSTRISVLAQSTLWKSYDLLPPPAKQVTRRLLGR